MSSVSSGPSDSPGQPSPSTVEARGRALSSPLRLRILRICLHRPRTNKEIADLLGISPAAALHHVRTLVRTGLLAPQEPRRGNRGAREIPYLATGASWDTPVEQVGEVLTATFLEELRQVPADEVRTVRLGLKLDEEGYAELERRLTEVLEDFKDRPPSAAGSAYTVFVAMHRDPQAD